MRIQRILTNNALVTLDENGKERIVCGKGIGYKKKVGDEIDQTQINQTFVLCRNEVSSQLEQFLNEIPMEYIELGNKIIQMARLDLGIKLNDGLIISLSDHLYSAMIRFRDGVNFSNGLIWEIRQFYKVEFEIGCKALDLIEESFKVRLPEDEAAYIALHLVNAERDDSSVDIVFNTTKLIQDVTNIIRYHFSIEFNTEAVYYYRFITHLKYFAHRMFKRKQYQDDDAQNLLDVVKEKYEAAYNCVCKIGTVIESKYDYVLSNEEKFYLTIHVQRVVYKDDN